MAEAARGRPRKRIPVGGDPDEVVVEELATDEPDQPALTSLHGEGATSQEAPPACPFVLCPICTILTAVGDARPALMEHLLLASREVLLAARALIDLRLDGAPAKPPPPKLERLSIK